MEVSSSHIEYIEYIGGDLRYFSENKSESVNHWRRTVQSNEITEMSVIDTVNHCYKSVKNFESEDDERRYSSYLDKIKSAYEEYLEEDSEEDFKLPSNRSLAQLNRFFPEYLPSKIDAEFFLDSSNGCFGVTITPEKMTKDSRVLKMLMMDNNEIYYSIVKKRNQMISTTGRAYYGTDVEDSDEIKNIIELIFK